MAGSNRLLYASGTRKRNADNNGKALAASVSTIFGAGDQYPVYKAVSQKETDIPGATIRGEEVPRKVIVRLKTKALDDRV